MRCPPSLRGRGWIFLARLSSCRCGIRQTRTTTTAIYVLIRRLESSVRLRLATAGQRPCGAMALLAPKRLHWVDTRRAKRW